MGGVLAKILLIAVVIVGVWYAYRWLNRLNAGAGRQIGPAEPPRPVQDMRACTACGTYVSASATSCGRKECPWPARGA